MDPAFVHDCSFPSQTRRLARRRIGTHRESPATANSRRSKLQGGVLQAVWGDRTGFLSRFRGGEKLCPELDCRLSRVKSECFRIGRFLAEYKIALKARFSV